MNGQMTRIDEVHSEKYVVILGLVRQLRHIEFHASQYGLHASLPARQYDLVANWNIQPDPVLVGFNDLSAHRYDSSRAYGH